MQYFSIETFEKGKVFKICAKFCFDSMFKITVLLVRICYVICSTNKKLILFFY